jgi:hypothetical protein
MAVWEATDDLAGELDAANQWATLRLPMKLPTPFCPAPFLALLAALALISAPALRAAAPATETPAKPQSEAPAKAGSSADVGKRGASSETTKDGLVGVEVAAVRFASIAPTGSSAVMWNETDIEINVRSSAPKGESRFVNRVRVTLTLAVDNPTGVRSFYQASAEAVALEVGRSDIRFYLPPEIVRRDSLRADPKFYAIEILVDGQPMPPGRLATNAPNLQTFVSKAAAEVGANAGILLPQYLSPFASDSARPSPAFVRLETTR